MTIRIDQWLCNGCGMCIDVCVTDILVEGEDVPVVAYPDECWHCGACMMDCPTDAIRFALPPWGKPVTIKVK